MSEKEAGSLEAGDPSRDPASPELFAAVSAMVHDARDHFRAHKAANGYIPKENRFPKMGRFDASGFPHITEEVFTGVPEYARLYGLVSGQHTPIGFADWDSFQALLSVVENNERLRSYLHMEPPPGVDDELASRFNRIEVGSIATGVFDRLMHVNGVDFDADDLLRVYLEIETALLSERLDVVFIVPIALTRFETSGTVHLTGGLFIAEIPEPLQLARMPGTQYGTAVNEMVLSAATHALLLTNWSISNEHKYRLGTDDIDWYPTDLIDRFFDAFRVVTGLDTGYAQVFAHPVRWAIRYRADLPPILQGALARRYPATFENWGWLQERKPVSADELSEVARIFEALATESSSVALAARRLSTAMLRDTEHDAILDLIIGLEAVLGDQTTTEVTHKLAIRAAAVLTRLDAHGADPTEVFKTVRQLYRYRSAVAHGNERDMQRKQTVRLIEGERRSVDIAARYLRRVIVALSHADAPHGGKSIDEQVVLPALSAPEPQETEPTDGQS